MSRLLLLYLGGLTLRSLVFAALAGVVTLPMRSVVGRHAVWTAVLACILLMPLADALLPASLVPARAPELVLSVQTFVVIPPQVAVQTRAPAPAPVPVPPPRDWWQFAAFVWIGVAAAFLCRLVLACAAIARIKRAGQPVPNELMVGFRTPTLRESGQVMIPLTVGLWNPALILPLEWREWDGWKLRAVLAHELTHVRRMDWAIAVVASLVRSVFWFNPLCWWLERHLSSLAEQASDEACVQATGDAPRYAETLLQFASVAKHGRRWIGGVAMAQYKISSRIERVLRLKNAGSGVLSKAGCIALCVVAISTLYVSAAAQSRTTAALPPLSSAEIVRVVQQGLPLPEQTAAVVTPTQQPVQPGQQPTIDKSVSPEILTPTARAGIFRYWTGWVPSAQQQPQNNTPPSPPAPGTSTTPAVNPDLVGEIRLILAPVEQAPGTGPGQVQIQTATGTNRFTGNAVWNVNGALNPNSWARSGNLFTFTFAMTGAQGRTLFFETSQGGTFSYGCPDCSFFASESGVRAVSASDGTGIIFRLSADGKSVTMTCKADECRVSAGAKTIGNTFQAVRVLKNSETLEVGIPPQPSADPNNPGLRCFSVFGNVKADGTPFTAADCPGGVAVVPGGLAVAPPSAIFFSVKP